MRIKKFKDFSSLKESYYEDGDDGVEIEPSRKAKYKIFEIVKNWQGEAAVVRNRSTKKLYFFYYDNIDQSDFYDYAWLPAYWDQDEDGKTKVAITDNFEYEDYIVEEYLNDNTNNLEYGEGLEDYEIGECDLILIDEPLKEEIEKVFGKFE
jgi:hypothetical protein